VQTQRQIASKLVEPLKTGELLVKEGLISLDDIDTVLSIQEKRKQLPSIKNSRLFGMILCDLNLITPMDNYHVLHKYNKLQAIESQLITKKMLSRTIVEQTIEMSKQEGIPLISALLKNKQVSATGMQKLLFDLFHIPFRSISDFVFNKKDKARLVQVLDKDRSIQQKIIPLVLKRNTILFGITDPDNLLFLCDLNERFPQYRFRALFIPITGFSWFYNIIYQGQLDPFSAKEKPVDLSLLLDFKAVVNDPETDNMIIETLYERYELLRELTGHSKRHHYFFEFDSFIRKNHETISNTYQSQSIEYSLKKDGKNVKIIAFPQRFGRP
jgi:hypothetical protein